MICIAEIGQKRTEILDLLGRWQCTARRPAGTFHGFPVVIDPAMPRDTINLEQGGRVVGTIRVASE